ncbi:hypothetical protein BDZ90DRAFT_262076 [Jaminaea rosea]|uniref:Uncharacterized protein n=1 Tax=Jaminaea rosea TaxID=1569628 RepID=A0A316UM43_9BASI|nr:hypothetical protein BDZ90DRAFT_262076 [Jaminaea rosea]PWN25878.1 hypothetical protein BDZ90DRAFT_262076 [Jaminaea rosea]
MSNSRNASSLLHDLFSRSELHLHVPHYRGDSPTSSSSSSSSRDIAFYDEHLEARLRLRLPSSPTHLPPPTRGHATYSIPLTLDDDESDDVDWEERTEQARSTRLVLLAVLCNLAIEARGSYVSPRPPLGNRDLVIPPTTARASAGNASTSVVVEDHARPRPAMSEHEREGQYQNIEAGLGDEVAFYSIAWQGNKVPTRPAARQQHQQSSSQTATPASQPEGMGCTVTYHPPTASWHIEWPLLLPITYARHRHPTPSLLLTASLSLRLSPTSPLLSALTADLSGQSQYLAMLPAELRPALTSGNGEEDEDEEEGASWADHDLLSPLSSGPVYPDESPSQRAARAASALAKLPLSRLPSKVLGSRLVTPGRSARDVGAKMRRGRGLVGMGDGDTEGEEGDLTDLSEGSETSATTATTSSSTTSSSARLSLTRASSASSDISDPALYGRSSDATQGKPATSRDKDDDADDIDRGSSVVTLTRSVRRGLDVRSAVGVRMRTTMVDDVELPVLKHEQVGEGMAVGRAASSRSRCLVLSVEVDNPSDSGMVFQVDNCEVEVVQPTSNGQEATASSPQGWQAEARLVRGGETAFDLEQGEQRNLVYFVRFVPTSTRTSNRGASEALASGGSTMRSISIVVHGKPVLLPSRNGEEDQADRLLTPAFSSVWSCTLDFRSLLEDAARREALQLNEAQSSSTRSANTAVSTTMPGAMSGSFRHSASALRQARARDEEERVAAAAAAAAASTPATTPTTARPGMDRTPSGLANGPLARFTSAGSARNVSTTTSASRGSSLQVATSPSTTAALPFPSSPSPGPLPSPSPLRQVSTSSSSSSTSTISPAGLGLLAQAKMRAASAAERSASFSDQQTSPGEHQRVSSLASNRTRTSSTSSGRSMSISTSWDRAPSGSLSVAASGSGPRERVRRSVSSALSIAEEEGRRASTEQGVRTVTPSSSYDGVKVQERGGATSRTVLPVRKVGRPSTDLPLLISSRVVLAPSAGGEEEGKQEGGRVSYAWVSIEVSLPGLDQAGGELAGELNINYVPSGKEGQDAEYDTAVSSLSLEGANLSLAAVQKVVERHSSSSASLGRKGGSSVVTTVLALERNVPLNLFATGHEGGRQGSAEVPLLIVRGAKGGEDDEGDALLRLIEAGSLQLGCAAMDQPAWTLKLGA